MPSEPTQDNTPHEGSLPAAETSAAPPAAAASAAEESVTYAETRTAPPAPRRRRGLLIAVAIVGAVVVLGATFGGGVLVGSFTHFDGQSMRQAHRAPGEGPQGERPGHGFAGPRGGQQDSDGSSYPVN